MGVAQMYMRRGEWINAASELEAALVRVCLARVFGVCPLHVCLVFVLLCVFGVCIVLCVFGCASVQNLFCLSR
jgi:hypothetical protein